MKVKVASKQSKETPKPKEPRQPKSKSIFQRIAEIVINDIKAVLVGMTPEEKIRYEDYKRFCELARGERR